MPKACLYSSSGDYQNMADQLRMYIANFDIEEGVQPFMLTYRDYHLYMLETGGVDPGGMWRFFERLPGVMRMHSTRVFAVWTAETWRAIRSNVPSCLDMPNIVNCDQPNWVSELITALKAAERRIKDANCGREGEGEELV